MESLVFKTQSERNIGKQRWSRSCGNYLNFIVVLISLVVIFKSQLTSLVETIFEKITSESSGI